MIDDEYLVCLVLCPRLKQSRKQKWKSNIMICAMLYCIFSKSIYKTTQNLMEMGENKKGKYNKLSDCCICNN